MTTPVTDVVDPLQLLSNRVQVALAVTLFLEIDAEKRTGWVNDVLGNAEAMAQLDDDLAIILGLIGYDIAAEPELVDEPVRIGQYL